MMTLVAAVAAIQPDVLVLPLVGDPVPSGWPDAGRLLLAIEVLSPSSIRADRFLKREKYQAMGWPTWLVDLEQQMVEVWHPDTEAAAVYTERLQWSPQQGLPSLVIDLRAIRQSSGSRTPGLCTSPALHTKIGADSDGALTPAPYAARS